MEDFWFFNKVFCEDWGFIGLVMLDWYGIKDCFVVFVVGGDFDMFES